ncbi:hypothetical protein [Butyrivibrio sp. INlla16]|uniref:hypothetical protein n=1 Tax=Butyrivibrio sp. INlla16 TaxID=1520807 RepID=UPI00089262A4|nr:hypothetical protein [Butyrivibrio sp. INlla16]SDB15013.1 hypothetical protein SAMN02910263_00721 [Butyrivibrio sp. INlla16]
MKLLELLRKKNNDRGASIVVALVVFIICSFISLAIVNSAFLNARRTVEEKKEEIAYAATTKAMDLIRECIESDATYRYEEGVSASLTPATGEPIIKGFKDELGETVKTMAESVAGSGAKTSKDITFVSDGVNDKLHGTLKGRITMYPSYTISVDVWIDGGDVDYPLTLTIPGSSELVKEDVYGTKTDTGSYTTKDVKYISWSKTGMYVTGKKLDS